MAFSPLKKKSHTKYVLIIVTVEIRGQTFQLEKMPFFFHFVETNQFESTKNISISIKIIMLKIAFQIVYDQDFVFKYNI